MGRSIREGRCLQLIAYEPLHSQERFHRISKRFKGFSGPIGSGKSQALCHEAIRMAYRNPGCMGLIGAPTYPMLRDATQRALLAVLDANEIPYRWHRSEGYLELEQCRSRVLLRSLDEYERLRGTNLAWFGVDELTYCKEQAWLRLEGRLRDPKAKHPGGFAVWTPKGPDWVYRRFVATPGEDYECVLAKPQENKHILNVDPKFYERLRSTYSEAFYRQEVLGEYVLANGLQVYTAFKHDLHVKPLSFSPLLPILWTLDFNVGQFCTLLCQRVEDSLHVVRELVLQRATTQEMAVDMNALYGQRGHSLVIYGDASGNAAQTNGPSNYKQLLAELGSKNWKSVHLRVPRKNPAVRERIHLVNCYLQSESKEVRVYIDPSCRWLIADLEKVQYYEDGVRVDKESDSKRTHASDALGYLIWEEFGSRPTIGEQPLDSGYPLPFG